MGRMPIQLKGMPYPPMLAFPGSFQALLELKSELVKSILTKIRTALDARTFNAQRRFECYLGPSFSW